MTRSSNCRPTWARISLAALKYNFKSSQAFIGDEVRYLAVVKADAYGHGSVKCARALEAAGVDWFGVALPEEGLSLRAGGITKPILCLGGFWQGQEDLLLDHRITPVVFQREKVESLARRAFARNLQASVHLKIDTGMGRLGIRPEEIPAFIERFVSLPNIRLEGLMTHLAAADDLSLNAFTQSQVDKFRAAVQEFKRHGIHPVYLDLANSPGAVAHPAARGNMVRLGGILYGLTDDVLPDEAPRPVLKPVLSLHSRIAHLKRVSQGESLGYGRTFTTRRESLIASIPIGYADGLPRALSNNGRVLINGAYAPIVGRVSMDWTLCDLTEAPDARIGDEVVLIGEQNGLRISAEEVARLAGTISYEITCGISPRVPRIYVEG